MKKSLFSVGIVVGLLLLCSFNASRVDASALQAASASATTSRPSASAPLSSADPLNTGSSQVTVVDNTSTFLASDSAKFFKTGLFSETLNVATTSADKLTVYFTGSTANLQNKTSVLAVPITAMHTIAFTTQTAIPSGGKIYIQYPNTATADTNQASPSANTWMFNGLTSGNIKTKVGVGAGAASISSCTPTAGTAGTAPSIVCTTTGATINSGVPIWIFIGCSAIGGVPSCTTQVPTLINPTAAGGARGVSTEANTKVKNIILQTQDASSNVLDTTTLKMGVIESVFVVAHVDPTFSFTISGSASGSTLNNAGTCTTGYGIASTNSGFASTPTEVNLGTVDSNSAKYASQSLTVTSNTASGYAITATSSGFLVNPSTGWYIINAQGNVTNNDFPQPVALPAGATPGGYGITACDAAGRVNSTFWGSGTPKFANPSPNFYYTLVNYTGTIPNGNESVYVVYGVKAAATTPPGDYWQIVTYTASPTF